MEETDCVSVAYSCKTPMSKFNTLKQCTFIISHINALAEWFLVLWLGSLGAHLWSGVGCDLALLILAGCGPLLGCSWGLAGQLVPGISSTWSLHLQLSQASH